MKLGKPLVSSRLTVRSHQKDDLPFITAMWFDEENGKYMSDPTPDYVDEVYQKALDGLEDDPNGYYLTVVLHETGEIVGTCCLFPKEKTVDIGYCIRKDHWKQGFGTELLSLLIGWAREHGMREITAEVAKDNIASNRLLLKNGFQVKTTSRFQKYHMDIWFDSHIYSLNVE